MSFEILRRLYNEDLFVEIGNTYGKYFAQLKENSRNAKLKKVRIIDIDRESLLLKIDNIAPPASIFKGKKGERKRCDYILITKKDRRNFLVFIEMKSRKLKEQEVIRQFKGAECIVDYSSSILQRFHDQADYFTDFAKRFVCFYKPGIAKRATRPKKISQKSRLNKNKFPDKMLKYADPFCPSINELI